MLRQTDKQFEVEEPVLQIIKYQIVCFVISAGSANNTNNCARWNREYVCPAKMRGIAELIPASNSIRIWVRAGLCQGFFLRFEDLFDGADYQVGVFLHNPVIAFSG
jgi:hypothetical protein